MLFGGGVLMVGSMKTDESSWRTERDSLGERRVPAGAMWGAHTSRSLENFPFEGERLDAAVVRGMAEVKRAAARANAKLGVLDPEKAEAIAAVCGEVAEGRWDGEFGVSRFQAGSGTSSHMNLNEVVANAASMRLGGGAGKGRKVHPNDDVNKGQSTNDVFPSGGKVALVRALPGLLEALMALAASLRAQGERNMGIRKAGRTHLQDAVPTTLGLEFRAWAWALDKDVRRLERAREGLLELSAGGNAIGTGINVPPGFREALVEEMNDEEARRGGERWWRMPGDGMGAVQFLTDFAEYSGALRCAALDVQKIANDLRLLASGPRTGLGEVRLPPVEAGSSIMPGKVNPSICEAAGMAAMEAQGLDHAVALGVGAGQLELNTHMPLVVSDCLRATRLLKTAARILSEKCVAGMEGVREVCERHLEESAAMPTLLNPALGYERAAEVAKEAVARGKTLREVALEKGWMTEGEYEGLVARSLEGVRT